jgi:hypothetical protein
MGWVAPAEVAWNRARFATRVHVGEILVIDGEAEFLVTSRS